MLLIQTNKMTRRKRHSLIEVSNRENRDISQGSRKTKYEAVDDNDLKSQIGKPINSRTNKSSICLTSVGVYFLTLILVIMYERSQALLAVQLDASKMIIDKASFIVHYENTNWRLDRPRSIGDNSKYQRVFREELRQDETQQKLADMPEDRVGTFYDEDRARAYLNSIGQRSVSRTSQSILNRRGRSTDRPNHSSTSNKVNTSKIIKIGRFPSISKVKNQITRSTRSNNNLSPPPIALSQPQALRTNPRQNVKCALILQRTYVKKVNPISTSTTDDYDSNNNDLNDKASLLQPTGKQERVCITSEDVNKAIAKAKQQRGFTSVPDEEINSIEPSPPVIAELGELNQEVTKILSQNFDLSADEILNGLPLIDMSRTDFWPICPLMVKPVLCDPTGRFRSFTGHCNNLNNPAWGAAQTPFVRYLAPAHPDGIHLDRVSALDGSELPSPRLVTSMVHRDHDQPSGDLSLLIMVWGQIIDHDVALAAPPRGKFKLLLFLGALFRFLNLLYFQFDINDLNRMHTIMQAMGCLYNQFMQERKYTTITTREIKFKPN